MEHFVSLSTSAEELQKLLHVCLPVDRSAALELVRRPVPTLWSVEPQDVRLARPLIEDHPELPAR